MIFYYNIFYFKKFTRRWFGHQIKYKDYEVIALITYLINPKSHKFTYNYDYNIYEFHFLYVLRKDKKIY